MSGFEWTLLILAAIAGTGISAIFSGMEIGLYTLNRVRLELRIVESDVAARILRRLLDRPSRMLAIILVGTNAANQLSAWSIAELLHGAGYGPIAAIIIDTVILVPVLLILAEVLPKDLFRAHGDRWCYALARPLRCVELLLQWTGIGPIIEWFGRGVASMVGGSAVGEVTARQRMSDLLKEGVDAGVLSAGQTDLLDRAMHLRERVVSDEMVPWATVQTLNVDADADARRAAIDSRWSRLPVLDADGEVSGIASVLDLDARPESSIDEFMLPPMFLGKTTTADAALRALRNHQAAIAIVQDSDGQNLGIVTIKDLVRPLLG
ncbi:MAG: CNNM domain-containing protein [Phycisphaerales bacterium]|jgi:CBS domain containing-hemolysin-like protein|nr:CNNM domain-containing protein [Phycisphaerales bacterium]MDP6987772.1 CNNM domain-containing protein [Phycisphaerales bacterium]